MICLLPLQVNGLAAQVCAYIVGGLDWFKNFGPHCFQRCQTPPCGAKRPFEFGRPLQDDLLVLCEIAQIGGAPISERSDELQSNGEFR